MYEVVEQPQQFVVSKSLPLPSPPQLHLERRGRRDWNKQRCGNFPMLQLDLGHPRYIGCDNHVNTFVRLAAGEVLPHLVSLFVSSN